MVIGFECGYVFKKSFLQIKKLKIFEIDTTTLYVFIHEITRTWNWLSLHKEDGVKI